MSFDKIKIISTRLKYGVSPSPADEVEQHVTIWSNGEVKISRYVFRSEEHTSELQSHA